jgi:hypothetical protein
MSFTSTYSSLSDRGWQSGDAQQIYSLIQTQFGPPNNRAYFGEFVAISDYNISNRNLSLSGGFASTSFPNGFVRGSFSATAFGGIRQTFTGSNGSTVFGTHCAMSADAKYAAVSGNGNVGSSGNLNIYSSDINYDFSLQYNNAPVTGSYRNMGLAMNDAGTAVTIGVSGANSVDVYGRTGNTWSLSTSLTPNVGNIPQVGFGLAISYGDANTLIVGAPGGVSTSGTAFIYVNNSQVARIFPSISSADDAFGTDVAMSADANYLVVGSRNTGTTGAAFVYANTANTWTELAMLTPTSTAVINDNFGQQVAISNGGNTVVVGDPFADHPTTGQQQGTVYVFTKTGNSYIQTQEILNVTGNTLRDSNFGAAIAMTNDGTRMIVGDLYANTGLEETGAVYLYQSFF